MRATLLSLATLLFLCVVPARAQSRVQLGFAGEVDIQGGAHYEIEFDFLGPQGEARGLTIHSHFAQHTSAADLAQLVSLRLTAAGGHCVLTGEHTGQRANAQLFVEDVLAIRLRLGYGVTASVTTSEEAPGSLRVLPPLEGKGAGQVMVTATTEHPHTHARTRKSFFLQFDSTRETSQIAQDLVTKSMAQGWQAELQNHDTWRPTVMSDGARVMGCSIELLAAYSDWRIEVQMLPKRQDR